MKCILSDGQRSAVAISVSIVFISELMLDSKVSCGTNHMLRGWNQVKIRTWRGRHQTARGLGKPAGNGIPAGLSVLESSSSILVVAA